MWTMSYREYLELPGTKEGIKEVKAKMKGQQERYGHQVEDGIKRIVSDIPGFTVKDMTPQMDLGFGADMQIAYKENGKNYSFYADITSNQKQIMYLTAAGNLTEEVAEAFCYRTEYFSVRFGLKKQHQNFFYYEKPVVVLYIENYVPTTGLALHHIHVIGSLMQNLNSLLMKQGFGARASQKVRPNPKRFPDAFKAYKTASY